MSSLCSTLCFTPPVPVAPRSAGEPLLSNRFRARSIMPGAVNARASVAPVSRRRVLTAAGATAFAALASHLGPCAAAPSLPVQGASGRIVESSEYLYAIPSSGLSKNTASLNGGRVATIFVDESDGDSNISCVETPIQSDFQKLTSFGPIDNVLETVCPKAIAGNKVIQVDTSPSQNAYIIEYQIKPAGDIPLRHLITVFSLQPGAELITLTCQSREENWASKEKMFKEVVQSYKLKLRD